MRLTSIVSLSAALLLAAPVAAQSTSQAGTATTSAGAAQGSKSAKPADGEKKVCKRLETSGTRMFERVCLTKQEWEKVEQEK